MIDKVPPNDGSYIPSVDNEPSAEFLDSLWDFQVIEIKFIDGSTDHYGVWSWNGFDIYEEDVFDDGEYDFDEVIGTCFGLYLSNQSESTTINSYDTVHEAQLDAWYLFYNVLAYAAS
jgi:hypothetical protein